MDVLDYWNVQHVSWKKVDSTLSTQNSASRIVFVLIRTVEIVFYDLPFVVFAYFHENEVCFLN